MIIKTTLAAAAIQNRLKDAGSAAGYAVEGGGSDVYTIVGRVIYIVLSVMGMIFLGYLLYAGYLWMTARGEQEQVIKAKDTIERNIIGLVIIFVAYAITRFVISKLTGEVLR